MTSAVAESHGWNRSSPRRSPSMTAAHSLGATDTTEGCRLWSRVQAGGAASPCDGKRRKGSCRSPLPPSQTVGSGRCSVSRSASAKGCWNAIVESVVRIAATYTISQYDEESARCRASSRPARPSASSPSTPSFTTSSTSSDIYFRGPPSTAFVLPLITPRTRRPLRLKGSRPRPQLRPTGVSVSKPSQHNASRPHCPTKSPCPEGPREIAIGELM